MNYWFFLILPFLIFTTPIFAQTTPDETSNQQYILKFDDHDYVISYDVNANVLAMEIDSESKSLLIGLENTHDSQFSIDLEHELINAPNDEFVVLVDGQDMDYQIASDSNNSKLNFFIPAGTEEVEIIGTHVIPEFPLGVIFGFVVMIFTVTIFAKIKTPFFKL
jgi:hypothetical protein